jgi:membrane protease YdiL (CAAX protease family)
LNGLETNRRVIVVVGVVVEAGLGVLAWILGWCMGQPAGASLRPEWAAFAWGVAATGPLILVFVGCQRSSLKPFARIRTFFDETLRPLFAQCSLGELALVATAAGIGEELLFRGVVQAFASRWLGPGAGLAVSNLLFGLLHPITPAYVVLAGLMGAYLGALWLATGNLFAPITAHALYDFLALAYLLRKPQIEGEPEQPHGR